ncbi:MAG: hypothetical protein ACXACK_19000 [Candidatus Hodarchaeales archaeon]
MSNFEIPFNIGFKIGELKRQAEIVDRFAKNPSKQRPNLEVIHVFDSLRYILHELELLHISEAVLNEIREYLDDLSGGRFSAAMEEVKEKSDEMLLSRIKNTLYNRIKSMNRNMKQDEAQKLALKLSLWRDRISNDFTRIKTNR